jgi:hypothetical protein
MGKTWRERRKPKTGRMKFKEQAEVAKVLWLIDKLTRSEKPGPRNPRPSEHETRQDL